MSSRVKHKLTKPNFERQKYNTVIEHLKTDNLSFVF